MVWCELLCFDGRMDAWSLIGGDVEKGWLEGNGEEVSYRCLFMHNMFRVRIL